MTSQTGYFTKLYGMLRSMVQMLYVYDLHLSKVFIDYIVEFIEKMGTSDFKIATIEYFSRIYKDKNLFPMRAKEKRFFEYYWN